MNNDENNFESFDVEFKIISNRNEAVYVEGYVTINDAEAEDTDWYYWNGAGYDSHQIIWYDDESEKWEFESDMMDEVDWTTDVILQSNKDENRTYRRENLTLIINEGARMECNVEESPQDGDYWAWLEFRFNGERLNLDYDSLNELGEEIDSTYACEKRFEIEDESSIVCEISKTHYGVFTDDEYYIEETNEIMDSHLQKARKVFAQELFDRINYDDDLFEESFDEIKDDELFDLYLWSNNEISAKEFADKNGYEWD